MALAYIGMGANIASPAGPPERTLAAAVQELARLGRVECQSSLYSTKPVGFANQPRFVNAVVGLETPLGARELLDALLGIELTFGRDRSFAIHNGPRPLDLDLLLLGNLQIHEPGLDLPHPRMHERIFVMAPLSEIAPDTVVVTLGLTVKQLLQGLRTGFPAESDAILPLENDLWRARPCGHRGMRTGAPDTHGQR
jgi:2-amino-4-hydroxy-6-hydroxymethyldihydropteridine diphosphokinase